MIRAREDRAASMPPYSSVGCLHRIIASIASVRPGRAAEVEEGGAVDLWRQAKHGSHRAQDSLLRFQCGDGLRHGGTDGRIRIKAQRAEGRQSALGSWTERREGIHGDLTCVP